MTSSALCGTSATLGHIDLSIDPETLPFKSTTREWKLQGQNFFLKRGIIDLEGDGNDEFYCVFTVNEGKNQVRSAIVFYENLLAGSRALSQYNGPYSGDKIRNFSLMDIIGDSMPEMVLLRAPGDSVIFEILQLDSVGIREIDVKFVIAAMASRPPEAVDWHDLAVEPLAGLDINGDGFRDLIYSRSGKLKNDISPDSAFERAIIAYDLQADSILWKYNVPDPVSADNFIIIRTASDSILFVCNTAGTANRYETNGMTSEYSYVFAIDTRGHELWRKQIGLNFFYPKIIAADATGDGIEEVYFPIDPRISGSDSLMRLVCANAATGVLLDYQAPLDGNLLTNMYKFYSPSDSSMIIIVAYDNYFASGILLQYTPDLHFVRGLEGDVSGVGLIDNLIEDDNPEILVGTKQHGSALLNHDFEPKAIIPCAAITYQKFGFDGDNYVLADQEIFGFAFIDFERQPLPSLIYARYKWWLAVVSSAILMGLLMYFGRWLFQLYRSSAGLPSLDKINAMVISLNRHGRITYANTNPLVDYLLGKRPHRRQCLRDLMKANHPGMVEVLDKVFKAPYLPIQERIDISKDGDNRRMELYAYPRLDRNNNIMGVALIGEDISQQVTWERKIVLGEAAQKWIHRLKGGMATILISIDNLLDAVGRMTPVGANEEWRRELASVRQNILESAEMATKILHFTRIAKPVRVPYQINRIIDEVLASYIDTHGKRLAFNRQLEENLPVVDIDPEQIAEVIDNLLSNAVKAIPENGTVRIVTRMAGNLLNEMTGSLVEILVEDSGRGIAPHDMERLFTPGFYRFKGGTGIGLAIIKEIVDNHGGKIMVDSNSGTGTKFVIRLPVVGKTNE